MLGVRRGYATLPIACPEKVQDPLRLNAKLYICHRRAQSAMVAAHRRRVPHELS